MFFLFNKTYLEYDLFFSAQTPFLLASKKWIKDPLLSGCNTEGIYFQADSFKKLLEKNFDSDLEKLWQFLYITKEPELDFFLYLDPSSYYYLQIVFWKSIFKDLSIEIGYFLHKVFVQHLKINLFFTKDYSTDQLTKAKEDVHLLSELDFAELYESAKPSSFLSQLPEESRGYEYLLAHYLYINSRVKNNFEPFNKKLQFFCHKLLVEELDVIKGDFIRNIYALTKPQSQENWNFMNEVSYIDMVVRSKEGLSWLVDKSLKFDSLSHIKDNYGSNVFLKQINEYLDFNRNKLLDARAKSDASVSYEENEMTYILQLILEEKYFKILNLEIKGKDDNLLFNNRMRYQVNTLFISYLYDLFRVKDINQLQKFRII